MVAFSCQTVSAVTVQLYMWYSATCTSAQTLEQTLGSADQQLDALTSRVASLSDRLDTLLDQMVDADYVGKRLTRRLDDTQGNHVLQYVGYKLTTP